MKHLYRQWFHKMHWNALLHILSNSSVYVVYIVYSVYVMQSQTVGGLKMNWYLQSKCKNVTDGGFKSRASWNGGVLNNRDNVDLLCVYYPLHPTPPTHTHTHWAISMASVHFFLMSSVLQKIVHARAPFTSVRIKGNCQPCKQTTGYQCKYKFPIQSLS